MAQDIDAEYQVMSQTEQAPMQPVSKGQLSVINWDTRLPYDDRLDRDYQVKVEQWADLCDAIFPGVLNPNSIVMAIRYCRGRNLDIFKRPISIVPMWRKGEGRDRGKMVDTIWPGIAEVRITALRTGECAGIDPAEWGDDLKMLFEHKNSADNGTTKLERLNLIFPRWCRYTVRRVVKGKERTFAGPQVHWLETYAQHSRFSEIPNAMWEKRPRGQLDKCAEAAGWRRAFPEELPGGGYIGDEMENKEITTEVSDIQRNTEDNTDQLMERQSLEAKGATSTGWTKDTGPQPSDGENARTAGGSGQHPTPGPQRHDKPSDGSAATGEPGPAGGAPKPTEVPRADSGPPRPPPRRASSPAPTSAAESSSPKAATENAATAAPSSSAPIAEPAEPTPTQPPIASSAPLTPPGNFTAPRPPKPSRSMSTTATARADAAVNGSPSNGPQNHDPLAAWIAARPSFLGDFKIVTGWVTRLYEMATSHDDLNELMLHHVDAHIDAVFPQDRDTLLGLFKAAEQKFAP
jgi:phage recombination protein Bet